MISNFIPSARQYQGALAKVFVFALLFIGIASFSSCEDDPILPASEVDESGGGSYGKMRLSSDGYYEVDSLYNENPEVY